MLIRRAPFAEEALPLRPILLSTVIVTVGHSAAPVSLLGADVDRCLVAGWIYLALLFSIECVLVTPEGLNWYSYLGHSASSGRLRSVMATANLLTD